MTTEHRIHKMSNYMNYNKNDQICAESETLSSQPEVQEYQLHIPPCYFGAIHGNNSVSFPVLL